MARQRSHSIAFKQQLRPAADIGPISAHPERKTYSFEAYLIGHRAGTAPRKKYQETEPARFLWRVRAGARADFSLSGAGTTMCCECDT
jgi:hypothetical protein